MVFVIVIKAKTSNFSNPNWDTSLLPQVVIIPSRKATSSSISLYFRSASARDLHFPGLKTIIKQIVYHTAHKREHHDVMKKLSLPVADLT